MSTVALPVTIDVEAQVDTGIAVTADFPSLSGDPGSAFTYTLTITNNTPESADVHVRPHRRRRAGR